VGLGFITSMGFYISIGDFTWRVSDCEELVDIF